MRDTLPTVAVIVVLCLLAWFWHILFLVPAVYFLFGNKLSRY